MSWRWERFVRQARDFESFSKFFTWLSRKYRGKDVEKEEKYAVLAKVAEDFSDVCMKLADAVMYLEEKR